MDWDWNADPAYESERIRIDGTLSPVGFCDMKLPRQVEDREVDLMLSLADFHLEKGLPFIGLVRHQRGTGVIGARQRNTFAEWLDARHEALKRDDFGVVVVVPEPIVRAVSGWCIASGPLRFTPSPPLTFRALRRPFGES